MAVYTTLEHDDIAGFIAPFGIGELVSFNGISEGMENTNYFVTSSSNHLANETAGNEQGDYVLTIFEELPESHLPFHLQLLHTLADAEIPVAAPITDYHGKSVQHIKGKPALLCPRLKGQHLKAANAEHCRVIGKTLAKMHLATQKLTCGHEGIRNHQWLTQSVNAALKFFDLSEQQLARQTLDGYLKMVNQPGLNKGIIHGDLFRDNALFEDDQLTGIIDFYNAGEDFLLYDLAVVVNDWCNNEDGSIDPQRYIALLQSYDAIRPLTDTEKCSWPIFLQISALRFWVSRMLTIKNREQDNQHELNTFKNPEPFKQILLHHHQNELTVS